MKKYLLILILFVVIVGGIAHFKAKPSTLSYQEQPNISSKILNSSLTYTYDIRAGELIQDLKEASSEQNLQIWNYFAKVIPVDLRQDILVFEVIDDVKVSLIANISALSDQKKPDQKSWKLKINKAQIYIQNNKSTLDKELLKSVFIHEIAHLLTLNNTQINLDSSLKNIANKSDYPKIFADLEAKCQPNYFVQEGCTKTDSYLNQFYQKFWQNIWSEYVAIQNESDNSTFATRSEDFYKKYQKNFTSRISAINPEEDIAESFSYFVLHERPPILENVADQKQAWFWSQSDLVTVREKILNHLNNQNNY